MQSHIFENYSFSGCLLGGQIDRCFSLVNPSLVTGLHPNQDCTKLFFPTTPLGHSPLTCHPWVVNQRVAFHGTLTSGCIQGRPVGQDRVSSLSWLDYTRASDKSENGKVRNTWFWELFGLCVIFLPFLHCLGSFSERTISSNQREISCRREKFKICCALLIFT